MNSVTIPQIKNTFLSALAIAFLAFSFSMVQGLRHHEAHSLADWAEILWDAGSYAAIGGFGWICTKSPLAKTVAGLFEQEGTKITEDPVTGKKTTEISKTTVQVEAPIPEPKKEGDK